MACGIYLLDSPWHMSLRDGSPCTDLQFQLFRGGHQYDYQNPEGLVDINCVDADGVMPMEEAARKSRLDVVSIHQAWEPRALEPAKLANSPDVRRLRVCFKSDSVAVYKPTPTTTRWQRYLNLREMLVTQCIELSSVSIHGRRP